MKRITSLIISVVLALSLAVPAFAAGSRFSDVPVGSKYYDAIEQAVTEGYMKGYGGGRFGPDDPLTRAQVSQVLYNKYGTDMGKNTGFSDVPAKSWAAKAVTWAVANKVIKGYGGGKFGPKDGMSRQQLITVLYRWAGSPAVSVQLDQYTDGSTVASWAQKAYTWALQADVVEPAEGATLRPRKPSRGVSLPRSSWPLSRPQRAIALARRPSRSPRRPSILRLRALAAMTPNVL